MYITNHRLGLKGNKQNSEYSKMGKRGTSKKIMSELVKSEQAIREKYKKLKLSKAEAENYLSESLKPITEPLKTLVKSSEAVRNMSVLLKEPKGVKNKEHADFLTNNENNKEEKEKVDKSDDEQEEGRESEEEEEWSEETEEEEEQSDESEEKNPLSHQDKSYEVNAARFGPIAKKYFLMHYKGNNTDLDRTYGIYSDGKRWYLGDSPIQISKDSIFLHDEVYNGTKGLFELLFLKNPDISLYNENDLTLYKKLLLATNAHKQRYDVLKQVNSNRGRKYVNVVKDLFAKEGSGVHLNSIHYEYWDDPNELVDRLRLLVASKEAGNSSVNNEIISIIEELRESKLIE